MEKKKILFISQEILPFLPKSDIATTARKLPQGVQELGKEIRVFTPKYGVINERRHQLHEVIRLSGMNLVIDDVDHPLIIKVASLPTARMQVYFIDNEEYFKRKNPLMEDDGTFYKDNDERAIFFCRGVLETVKKLGWKPDVVHCHGWLGALMPLYLKKMYQNDPHFSDVKVVFSLYNDRFEKWDERLIDKLKFDGFDKETLADYTDTSYLNIINQAIKLSDGVVKNTAVLDPDLQNIFDTINIHKETFTPEETQAKIISEFFTKVIEEEILA
jgi:starch synthase